MKANHRGQPRIGHRSRRNHRIVDLDIARGVFRAEAHRVNRDVTAAQRGDRLGVDAARIVGAIGEEHDRADRQFLRFTRELLEAVADARSGRGRVKLLQVGDPRELAVEAIEARLKSFLDCRPARRLEARQSPASDAWCRFQRVPCSASRRPERQ